MYGRQILRYGNNVAKAAESSYAEQKRGQKKVSDWTELNPIVGYVPRKVSERSLYIYVMRNLYNLMKRFFKNKMAKCRKLLVLSFSANGKNTA